MLAQKNNTRSLVTLATMLKRH